MRLFPRTSRLLIIPLLVIEMVALGFIPQVSMCRLFASNAACVSLRRVNGYAGLVAVEQPSESCCCNPGATCRCGIACNCTLPTHDAPISVPPKSVDTDQIIAAFVPGRPTIFATADSDWMHPASHCLNGQLEAPTLQHQHVRIQT